MIFVELQYGQEEQSSLAPAIVKALDFLRTTDFSQLENGRHELDGDKMFANIMEMETSPKDQRKAEAHEQYIDVQYLLNGEELIGFARADESNVVTDDLMAEHDAYLYQDINNEMELVLRPGQAVVFFPKDVHRTGCSVTESMKLRKVVVKIHVSLL